MQLVAMAGGQRFLSDQGMCFTMPKIPRGRADQPCNLVRVLKLCAIHLDHSLGISEQKLRRCFDDSCLPNSCWPEEQQIADRAAGGV